MNWGERSVDGALQPIRSGSKISTRPWIYLWGSLNFEIASASIRSGERPGTGLAFKNSGAMLGVPLVHGEGCPGQGQSTVSRGP